MPHDRPGLTPRLLEDAYAFNEARDQYEAWHLSTFKVPHTPPPPPPSTTRGRPRKPKVTIICPRCGASRTTGRNTACDPFALCRQCQAALIPLVPKEHRRRGVATAEGYRIARQLEVRAAGTGGLSPAERTARYRARQAARKRQQRASRPTGGAE